MKKVLTALQILFFGIILCLSSPAQSNQIWDFEIKGTHFIVMYTLERDRAHAQRVLTEAERFYDKIAYKIGHQNLSDFWTWEQRVKIMIFPDKISYLSTTGQPQWSGGFANTGHPTFGSRIIVTYQQHDKFLKEILPHELSHLILRDYIGKDKKVPIWFDEGVAQVFESEKKARVQQMMKYVVRAKQNIPMEKMTTMGVRHQRSSRLVSLFYAQSLSVVDFLMTRYGISAFQNLCRELKNGKAFDQAFAAAYPSSVNSISKMESQWIKFLNEQ